MKQYEHGGNVYQPSPTGAWLDFSANINPMGLMPEVRQTLEEHLVDVVNYPDPDAHDLKAAIAKHYGIGEEYILPGNGAAELIYLFFQVRRLHRVLVPVPAFSDYERAARAARSVVQQFVLLSEHGFQPDLVKMAQTAAVTDCFVFGNPNNPTGTIFTRKELLPLLEQLRGGSQWMLVDESFMDFAEEREEATLLPLVKEFPHLVVIHSLTKFYAMPGLRLGFAACSPELVKELSAAKDVWNVNVLAQEAGAVVLAHPEYDEATRKLVREERAFMQGRLSAMHGIRVLNGAANFLLLDVHGTGHSSSAIAEALRQHGILVRDCANYESLDAGWLRVAVRKHEENVKFLEQLEAIL